MRVSTLVALGLSLSALAGAPVATGSTGAHGAATSGGSAGRTHRTVTGARVVSYVKRFTGVPYVFGANGPRSFDCSGFTSFVYAHFGVHLSRSSYAQMRQGRPVRGPLRLGDLVFWDGGGHVGIYTGNSRFVSATVHRGIWDYGFQIWRQTQTYTTARRVLPSTTNPSTGGAGVSAASVGSRLPRNGGAADASPRG